MVAILLAALISRTATGIGFEFVPNTERTVGVFGDGFTTYGRLDGDGDFHPFTTRKTGVYSGRVSADVYINGGNWTPSPVYEFRSGILVPGTMRVGGKFVPTPDGNIIRFADYKYTPGTPRIYNLPGYFQLIWKSAPALPVRK